MKLQNVSGSCCILYTKFKIHIFSFYVLTDPIPNKQYWNVPWKGNFIFIFPVCAIRDILYIQYLKNEQICPHINLPLHFVLCYILYWTAYAHILCLATSYYRSMKYRKIYIVMNTVFFCEHSNFPHHLVTVFT